MAIAACSPGPPDGVSSTAVLRGGSTTPVSLRPPAPDLVAGPGLQCPRTRTGLTLLELVIVAALVGLLAAASLPAYLHRSANDRTAAAARALAADLRVARQEAITRRMPVTVAFAARDAACEALAASYRIAADAAVIKRACLPAGVLWLDDPPALVFDVRGTLAAPAAVTLRSERTGREHRVWVEAATGAVADDVR